MKKTNVVNVVKAVVKGIRLARLYGGRLTGIWFGNNWKRINDVYDIKVTDRYGKTTDIRIKCDGNLWIVKIDDVFVYELAMF